VVENLYQGLVFYPGNDTQTFVGVLATNWNVSADGLTYTFTLRHSVQFSDGVQLNAYDVWFNYYRLTLSNAVAGYILGPATFNAGNVTLNDLNTFNFTTPTASQLEVMQNSNQSIQVLDQYTIAFHFATVLPSFMARLAAIPGEILDPNFIQIHGGVQGNSTPNNYIAENAAPGTGPYVASQWIHGTSLTLTVNPHYWGPAPPISTVVVQFKSNALNAMNDLKSGAAQALYAVPFNLVQNIQGSPGVELATGTASFDMEFVSLNTAVYPLNITNVRIALEDAINRTVLVQALLNGYGTQTEGPIPQGMPGSNSSIKQLPYNLQAAENLLATAGFRNGSGIRTLTFDILSDPFSATVAQAIQSDWAKIGVTVKINVLTGTQVNSILLEPQPRGSDYPDMLLLAFSPDYAYPDDYATNILNINSIIDQSNFNDSLINNWTNQLLTVTSPQLLTQLSQNITLREQSLVSNIWLWQAGPGVPAYTSSVQFVHPVWNPMTFGFNYSNIYVSP